jgi:hypothetical protein
MKNIVIFDKDTERDEQIMISKPEGFGQPTNEEEAKKMIVEDIATATEGLLTLTKIAHDSGYMDGAKSSELIIKYFTDNFLTKEDGNEETK